jgi:signal transduction histidine kinase
MANIAIARMGLFMLSPEVRLSCRLDQKPGSDREQQRLQSLRELGLLETESIAVFEEATQTAAHFMDAPICILGVIDSDRHLFKSAVGLSRIGLMNDLAASRQLPRLESFCSCVVDSQNVLVIPDAIACPAFADSLLVQRYGICSYLGVPLFASNGDCVGSLAVMGLSARQFTQKEIELLQLTARWSMSEFERNRLLKLWNAGTAIDPTSDPMDHQSATAQVTVALPSIKPSLIAQMTQELCTPLTSILGMASVLGQGIYGSLSAKQKEYIEIIHNSGQYLLSLVTEIVELGALDDRLESLNLASIDIEMLCQQVIATLSQAAQRREQQLKLTVEPGQRIWALDKEKVRQMLYHLVFGVIQSSTADSIIRIHVSRRQGFLNLAVWASHPWLGDGAPQAKFTSRLNSYAIATHQAEPSGSSRFGGSHSYDLSSGDLASSDLPATGDAWYAEADESDRDFLNEADNSSKPKSDESVSQADSSRQGLGLVFSRQLAEIHGGSIEIRGSAEEGYRHVIKLPQLRAQETKEAIG